MKKKFISVLSLSLGAIFASAAVSACNNDRPLHIWSEEWSSNAATHWHACTDAGCPGKDAYDYHDFELISTAEEASCTKEGAGHYKCSVCGYEKDDVIPLAPHDYELKITLLAASCIFEGRGTYECKVCHHTENLQIPATGKHVFGTDEYDYDINNHWHVCKTEGCNATDEPAPHTAGEPVTTEPRGWADGKTVTSCTVCGYAMQTTPVPNAQAPASYDIEFSSERPAVGEVEYGQQTYTLTLKKGKAYTMRLTNALNSDGAKLNLAAGWTMGDGYSSHGLKIYYVENRSGKETEIANYGTVGGFKLQADTFTPNTVGEHKLVFRYETGVNDSNYTTRQIRVEHVIYITVV